MKSKKAFEFNFAWMFSLIAGAVILFLAIYGVVKLIGTERYKIDTYTAKQLSIIFEPMETGLASGKSNIAELKDNTRIYNECQEFGEFGYQTISLASESGIGKKWQEPGVEIEIPNKYIFSSSIEEGKTIYLFSKPFEMPWKVSEIIFMTTKEYCFVNTPGFIEEEVNGLGLKNVKLENCTDEIKVCFEQGECEINVFGGCSQDCESEYDFGGVEKNGKRFFYAGGLMYAAIFSDKEIYECNVKRLMKRLNKQALLFNDELNFLTDKCGNSGNFLLLGEMAKAIKKGEELLILRNFAREVEKQNSASQCRLW